MLHAREKFSRSAVANSRRHLLRLVLRDAEYVWELPAALKEASDNMMRHDPEEEQFPWSPEPLPYVIGQYCFAFLFRDVQ